MRILDDVLLRALQRRPMTVPEAAVYTGATLDSTRVQMAKLKKAGLIHDTGDRRYSESGRSATVWTARAAGEEEKDGKR